MGPSLENSIDLNAPPYVQGFRQEGRGLTRGAGRLNATSLCLNKRPEASGYLLPDPMLPLGAGSMLRVCGFQRLQISLHIMYRPRKKFVALVGIFSATAAFLMLHREDIREIPDRWHAPFLNPEPPSTLKSPTDIFSASPTHSHVYHPIDDLIERSESALENLLKKQNHNVSASAAAYRERRGRHPPPEFDKWFEYAVAHGCLVIEDFFDQIYRDIEPFWALTATHIRESAISLPNIIHVRNGKVSKSTDEGAFLDAYFDLFKELGEFLPDVDISTEDYKAQTANSNFQLENRK